MMARHLISPSIMLMIHMCWVTAGMCCLHVPPKAASGDLAALQHSQPDAVVLGAECVSQTLIPGVDHRSELCMLLQLQVLCLIRLLSPMLTDRNSSDIRS